MKKLLPVLLAFLILLTLPVHAADGKLTATAAPSGDKVTITVHLQNPGIVATRIFVRYDSKVLQLTSAENGEVFPKSDSTFGKNLSNDPYTMLWIQANRRDNNTQSGTLCTVTFDVTGGTETGKTSVRFAVDSSSTFDVDLNGVTIADCSCSVDVPVVTTKAGETTTTTAKPTTVTSTTAAKPPVTEKTTSAVTTTTKAQPTSSTTKAAATTTKITASHDKTTTLKMPDEVASAVSAAASSAAQLVKDKASSVAANVPSTAKEGASSAQPDMSEKNGTTAPAADETTPDILPADGTLSTVPELQSEPAVDPAPEANHRGFLWLLLLIPAVVAIVLVVRKKRS